jgi:hypothetical protein
MTSYLDTNFIPQTASLELEGKEGLRRLALIRRLAIRTINLNRAIVPDIVDETIFKHNLLGEGACQSGNNNRAIRQQGRSTNRTYHFVLQVRNLLEKMPRPLAKRFFLATSTDASENRFCSVRFHKQEGPQQVDWLRRLIFWFIGIEIPPNLLADFRLYAEERHPPCVEGFSTPSSMTAHDCGTKRFELI